MFSPFVFVGVAATFLLAVVLYLKWQYNHWARLGVPYLKPNLLFGNTKDLFLVRKSFGAVMHGFYDQLKANEWSFGGIYMMKQPFFLPTDPELIKSIMQKDFNHFTNRTRYVNEKVDPLSANLLNVDGKKWKDLRAKLTPTFSSGKMKFMFQTLVDCSVGLEPILEGAEGQALDIKEIVARYTTDVIGSCAFGIECNSLTNPNAEFRRYGKMVFEITSFLTFKRFFAVVFPAFVKLLGVRLSNPRVTQFFTDIVRETVDHREKHDVSRKDFMDLLIRLKNDARGLTMAEITAQSFLFFVAGFETSSTALSFCMFELSRHQTVQERLRREINAVLAKHDDRLTYESLSDMKYMDNVVDEALRMYPPAPGVVRICTKDYTVPQTQIVLREGTSVAISIQGLHYDPEHFPDPEVFDPDRFGDDVKATRHPYAFLPFGEGPRNCIGLRFGLMQIKVGLAALLRNYKFVLSERTRLPLRMQAKTVPTQTADVIWLHAYKIK